MVFGTPMLRAAALSALMVFALMAGERAHAAESKAAYFAGGCFWCVESDFESVRGVGDVVSGYTGGAVQNPTYKDVKTQKTGHFEAVRIPYDPDKVSYEQLLHAFFRSVDPTDAGGQFCDRGASYRTAIFVSNAEERALAERAKAKAERALGKKIVTPILDAATFYEAEEYHQNYYKRDDIVLTRRGPKQMKNAYKFYRNACGRDKRVRELWGKDAVFAAKYTG
jgi:peptide-methionine (S)-S-oxide reductase